MTIVSGSHHSPACSMPSTSNPASVIRSASCLSGISRSTYSFNHEIGTNIIFLSPTSDIYHFRLANSFEEPRIVCVEVADVVDAVSLQGHAFRAHAECEAAVHAGVIAAILQHDRMHHTCPQDFQPAG